MDSSPYCHITRRSISALALNSYITWHFEQGERSKFDSYCWVAAILIIAVISVLTICSCSHQGKTNAPSKETAKPRNVDAVPAAGSLRHPTSTRFLEYEELKEATNNFEPASILGEGGFGRVFKGVLSDGTAVAIKRLTNGGQQGDKEFLVEVDMLSRLQSLPVDLIQSLWCGISPKDAHKNLLTLGSRARQLCKAGLRTPQAIVVASISEIVKALFESSSWAAQDLAQWRIQLGVAKKIKNGARRIVLDKAEEARVAAFTAFKSLGLDVPQLPQPALKAAGDATQKEATTSSGEESTSSFVGVQHTEHV